MKNELFEEAKRTYEAFENEGDKIKAYVQGMKWGYCIANGIEAFSDEYDEITIKINEILGIK